MGVRFELISPAAANLYGDSPIDQEHIDFAGLEDSDFDPDEILQVMENITFPA